MSESISYLQNQFDIFKSETKHTHVVFDDPNYYYYGHVYLCSKRKC